VTVPAETMAALEAAGGDAPEVGLALAVDLVARLRRIAGLAGIHIMAMGRDETTRDLVERAGLFPRPTV
jgi:methylenetetrahydrofolate reductase (NADPH)